MINLSLLITLNVYIPEGNVCVLSRCMLLVPVYTSCLPDMTVLPDIFISSIVTLELPAVVILNARLLVKGLMILLISKSGKLFFSWIIEECFFLPSGIVMIILYHILLLTGKGSLNE